MTSYPPKGATKGMCADREEAVGSQDVIAAKCCPGHSLAAQGGKEKDKVGSWRKRKDCTSQNQKPFSKVTSRLCVQTSYFRGASASGPFLIKGLQQRHHLSGEC